MASEFNRRTVVLSGFALSFLIGGTYDYGDTKVGNNFTGLLDGSLPASYTTSGYPGPGVGQWDTNSSFPLPYPQPTTFSPTLCNGLSTNQCVYSISRNPGKYPYSESWNAGIQRELPWNLLLLVSYVGNRGVHLPSQLQPWNQLNPDLLNLCANDERWRSQQLRAWETAGPALRKPLTVMATKRFHAPHPYPPRPCCSNWATAKTRTVSIAFIRTLPMITVHPCHC